MAVVFNTKNMETNDLNHLIKGRRAVGPQFFTGENVDKRLILEILENANWAPSHKQTEPWRFVVFTGEGKTRFAEEAVKYLTEKYKSGEAIDIGKVEKFRKNISKSGATIAIILNRDKEESLPEWEETAAVAMAVQNMWLTATQLGLSAFWGTPGFTKYLSGLLGLEPNQKSLGFFYLGYSPIELPSPGRGPIEEKIRWAL